MDIKELRERRAQLEEEIYNALRRFTHETDVQISSVDVLFINMSTMENLDARLPKVKVEIRI